MALIHGSEWWLLFLGIAVFKKISFSYYMLIFVCALTTVGLLNVADNYILVYHAAFLILMIKFFFICMRKNHRWRVNALLLAFVIWCMVTIPFSMLGRDIVVLNTETRYQQVQFSSNQISQFGYLLIGFLTYAIGYNLLEHGVVSYEKARKWLRRAYIFVLLLALSQHFIPVEIISTYFRNALHGWGYRGVGARISSTFNEPSMLALFCAPIFAGYLYRAFTHYMLKDFLLSALFLVVTIDNASSSGIIGVLLTISLIFMFNLMTGKISKKGFVKIVAVLSGVMIVGALNWQTIKYGYDAMTYKIRGGVSQVGNARIISSII